MSFSPAIKEKLPEKFDPCFRCDKGINNNVMFGLMSNKFTRSIRISKFYGVKIRKETWETIDQRPETRDQRPENRDRRSENREQRTRIRE